MERRLALGVVTILLLAGCGADQEGAGRPLPALASAPRLSLRLGVEEAYAAIPHGRTTADLDDLEASDRERRYVALAFHVVDQAIALRVVTLQDSLEGRLEESTYFDDQDRLIAFLEGLDPPSALVEYHRQLALALAEQRAFFEAWRQAGAAFPGGQDVAGDERVRRASRALVAAYGHLLEAFPGASARNRQAFFDHHCALDFL